MYRHQGIMAGRRRSGKAIQGGRKERPEGLMNEQEVEGGGPKKGNTPRAGLSRRAIPLLHFFTINTCST